jgi:hypothetical protein
MWEFKIISGNLPADLHRARQFLYAMGKSKSLAEQIADLDDPIPKGMLNSKLSLRGAWVLIVRRF